MISEAGLLVHGGRNAEGEVLQDIAIFDARAGKWVLHHDTGFPRTAHTACNAAAQQRLAAALQQQPPGSKVDRGGAAASGAAAGEAAGSNISSSGSRGGSTSPVAANVLLYGGFNGEAVEDSLLQLTFLRQHRSSGEAAGRVWEGTLAEREDGRPGWQRGRDTLRLCSYSYLLTLRHALQAATVCGPSCDPSRRQQQRGRRRPGLLTARRCCPAARCLCASASTRQMTWQMHTFGTWALLPCKDSES